MKSYITKRGNKYIYVRRIPADLLEFFPFRVLNRSLKTGDVKEARLLASSYDYNVERAFMRLRTGMLGTFESQIVVERLTAGIRGIEGTAYGRKVPPLAAEAERLNVESLQQEHGIDAETAMDRQADIYEAFSKHFGQRLARRDTSLTMHAVEEVDKVLRKQYRVMLSEEEKKELALKFLHIDKDLALAEADVRRGEFEKLHKLSEVRDRLQKNAGTKIFLRQIVKEFYATYDEGKRKKVKVNSWHAVQRQVDFVYKVLGNIEFNELNSKAARSKLVKALQEKKKSTGEPISHTEQASHLKRLRALVQYAIDKYDIDTTNKIKTEKARQEQKKAFDFEDMKRLEEALCTAPMTYRKQEEQRHDRFWILLIAVLHGFRKTSIVNLHKRHLTTDAQTQLPCFDLTTDAELLQTKTENMQSLVPVHPLLLRLGFLRWVEGRELSDGDKLFTDTPDSFGQWFNGLDKTSGWNYDYISREEKSKTFHSFRHYFCCCMDELRVPEKQKNEMSGHSGRFKGEGTRQQSYLERVRVKAMADTFLLAIEPGRILMTDMDWDRLEQRAKELFFSI